MITSVIQLESRRAAEREDPEKVLVFRERADVKWYSLRVQELTD